MTKYFLYFLHFYTDLQCNVWPLIWLKSHRKQRLFMRSKLTSNLHSIFCTHRVSVSALQPQMSWRPLPGCKGSEIHIHQLQTKTNWCEKKEAINRDEIKAFGIYILSSKMMSNYILWPLRHAFDVKGLYNDLQRKSFKWAIFN